MVTYEIVGVVNFIKLSTFSLPIRIIFVKSIPKLFSIKYFTTLLLSYFSTDSCSLKIKISTWVEPVSTSKTVVKCSTGG